MDELEHEGGADDGIGAVRELTPWLISLAIHASIILAAFFVVWTVLRPAPAPRTPVVVHFDAPAPAPVLDDASPDDRPTDAPSLADRIPAPPERIRPELDALIGSHRSAPLLGDAPPPPAQRRAMIEARIAPPVRFAGLGASSAMDIVYVVDASGSMISAFPHVVAELERSIRRLESSQRVQVIFFGPGARGYASARLRGEPEWTTKLIRASQRNIDEIMVWARGVIPGGRSNPIGALQMALGLQPDAIFVLSSSITGLGEWEPDRDEFLSQIELLNPVLDRSGRRRAVIKTIQVLEEDPAGILRTIGRTHGGEDGYNFIPRKELLAR